MNFQLINHVFQSIDIKIFYSPKAKTKPPVKFSCSNVHPTVTPEPPPPK